MNKNCPNSQCPNYQNSDFVIKDGHFKRSGDSRQIQRFKCKICSKKFSSSTSKLEFRQQKRRVNPLIFKLLASNVSLRRTAKILNLSRGTVVRRLEYFGEKSRIKNVKFNERLKHQVSHMQFDDLITKESSKLEPLSITIAVDGEKRFILGARVSEIRAFGHLADKGKKVYPNRSNKHKEGLTNLFASIRSVVSPTALIRSDEHKFYPEFVKRYFPRAKYERYKSERGCVAGQGELKKIKYDPIFTINHTCAMLRANINRLIRKTWCTTKDPARLKDHLDLFICYYNQELLKNGDFIPSQ